MRPMSAIVLSVLLSAGPSGSRTQEEVTGVTYRTLQLHHSGLLEGNLDGKIHRISEGVDMTLVAETAENNLDIRSKTLEFIYTEGEKRVIDRIIFEGDVIFEQSGGVFRADKATVDFNRGKASFTGNVRVDHEQFRGVEAPYITLDLNTHDFVVGGPAKIEEIPLTSKKELDAERRVRRAPSPNSPNRPLR